MRIYIGITIKKKLNNKIIVVKENKPKNYEK